MYCTAGDNRYCGYPPSLLEKSMELDRTLVLPELIPGKERETGIDDRGVQFAHPLIRFHAEGYAGVELSCLGNQEVGDV